MKIPAFSYTTYILSNATACLTLGYLAVNAKIDRSVFIVKNKNFNACLIASVTFVFYKCVTQISSYAISCLTNDERKQYLLSKTCALLSCAALTLHALKTSYSNAAIILSPLMLLSLVEARKFFSQRSPKNIDSKSDSTVDNSAKEPSLKEEETVKILQEKAIEEENLKEEANQEIESTLSEREEKEVSESSQKIHGPLLDGILAKIHVVNQEEEESESTPNEGELEGGSESSQDYYTILQTSAYHEMFEFLVSQASFELEQWCQFPDQDELGLDQSTIGFIKDNLKKVVPFVLSNPKCYTLKNSKCKKGGKKLKVLQIVKNDDVIYEIFSKSFRLIPIYKNKILSELVLTTKIKIGEDEGTHGKVRLAYNLTKREYVVKKTSAGFCEQEFFRFVQKEEKPPRGIIPILYSTPAKAEEIDGKKILIHPYYESSLSNFLKNRKVQLDLRQKLKLFEDLIFGLWYIHYKQPMTTTIIQVKNTEYPIRSFPIQHLDIKPANVLIRKNTQQDKEEGEEWEGAICDFGFVCAVTGPFGTPYYMSPHQLKFNERINKDDREYCAKQIEYHKEFGQAQDVWAMGLVFLHILENTEKIPLPTLLEAGDKKPQETFRGISDIEQEAVNSNIYMLMLEAQTNAPANDEREILADCYLLVNEMLQVDLTQQISTSGCLEKVQSLLQRAKAHFEAMKF